MADAKRDANRVPISLGVDSSDGITPLQMEITEATGRLRVDAVVTTPTTYTEGDTDATIEGNVIMFEGGGDTIRAVSDVYPLPVDCTEVEDVDDDLIAASQVLPLKIVENYIYDDKSSWIRWQSSTNGYAYVEVRGLADSGDNALDINADGSVTATIQGAYDTFEQDASTEAINTIEYEHHEIHDGNHYLISDVVDLSQSAVYDMQFTTPNSTTWCHFKFILDAENETEWYIYEDASVETVGTAITPINNNRNSTNTSGVTVAGITNTSVANANADTDVSGATTIEHGIIGVGNRIAGTDVRENELVLKSNTTYCLRAIANTAGYIDFVAFWYEHADKN